MNFKYLIIVLILALLILTRKKMFGAIDAAKAITYAFIKYEKDYPAFAKTLEQVLRLETGHFKSAQFQETGTAGIEVGKWGNRFAKAGVTPVGTAEFVEAGTGKTKKFIKLKSVNDFADVFFYYIQDNKISDWNSKNPQEAEIYLEKLRSISTPIYNSLLKTKK